MDRALAILLPAPRTDELDWAASHPEFEYGLGAGKNPLLTPSSPVYGQAMRRAIIYVLLFPLFAGAFMFAMQRINPFHGDLTTRLLGVYALGLFPAIASAWTHDALRHRGYRSIMSVFVGAIAMAALVYFVLNVREPVFVLAYAVAGLLAAIGCWVVSRIGQRR